MRRLTQLARARHRQQLPHAAQQRALPARPGGCASSTRLRPRTRSDHPRQHGRRPYATASRVAAATSAAAGGTLAHGSGVTSVTHLATGHCEVTFCQRAPVRVRGHHINAHSQALGVFTAGGHLSADGVYVETKNQAAGLPAGRSTWPWTAERPAGPTQSSATPPTWPARPPVPPWPCWAPAVGRDLPRQSQQVLLPGHGGDPGNGLVFNPSGVYTDSGPNARTVYIETKNIADGLSGGIPFHLAVICPPAANATIAVVDASGQPLPACVVIATRGSANSSVPFDPATVEITAGPAPNTTGIQVRRLLFFGGHLASESFHAAMIC